MQAFARIPLSGVEIPEDWTLRRKMPPAPAKGAEAFVAKFDARTLVYDAFIRDGRLTLICPRLLNLWPVIKGGFRLNGKGIRFKRRISLRFEELTLTAPGLGDQPGELTLDLPEGRVPIPVHRDASEMFRGLRTALTMFKETPTEWITDWARWNLKTHGTNALFLVQNGEDEDYSQEILNRLRIDVGLTAAAVVHAPFPYGGNTRRKLGPPAKYLQVGMMNLARRRFFASAKSVLNVDIDEFVEPLSGGSIHAAAETSRLGVVHFTGRWAYSSAAKSGPQPQRAHHLTASDAVCNNPKWCLRPGSLADRFDWAVHRSGGPLFPLTRTGHSYWHFRSTTTGWQRGAKMIAKNAKADETLRLALEKVFG